MPKELIAFSAFATGFAIRDLIYVIRPTMKATWISALLAGGAVTSVVALDLSRGQTPFWYLYSEKPRMLKSRRKSE
jgi:hypothetical protein